MFKPSFAKLACSCAAALSLLSGACVDQPTTDGDQAALSNNLVSTTYYDCNTDEIVGEKTQGCVSGPAAQWGHTSSCYEIDSDTCETAEPISVKYCAFDNACDAFAFPNWPTQTYVEWLDAQR